MGETKRNIDMTNQTERPAENATPGAGPEIAADPRQMIAACNELGAMYRETGQYSLSLEAFANARSLIRETLGTGCAEYAATLNNMAGTCRLMKDYAQAEALFTEALDTCQNTAGEENGFLAGVLCNLSLTYREMNLPGKAIDCLNQALALIGPLPEHLQETAVIYNNLTKLYHMTGDKTQARFCLTRALQALGKCPEAERTHCAEILNSLAGYLYAEGDCETAAALYRRSARHTKRFFGENADYGETLQNLRWVYEKMGEHEKALDALADAEKVYLALYGPGHDRTRAVREDLERLAHPDRDTPANA